MLDLKSNELDWLATHLGHNIAVHREYYRLPMNVVEVAKVGKLLTAVEKGVQKYSGRSLDEIDLTDLGTTPQLIPIALVHIGIEIWILRSFADEDDDEEDDDEKRATLMLEKPNANDSDSDASTVVCKSTHRLMTLHSLKNWQ